MSRIRSIHPGLATDADFASISRDARYFFVLLLTQCDDFGAFEWKPLDLKIKLLPADHIDVDSLLAELLGINAVLKFEHKGKRSGLVRNFRKYQRPKKPSYFVTIPDDRSDEFRTYVGLTADSSPPDDVDDGDGSPPAPPKPPPSGGKSPQKGGREERRKEETPQEGAPLTENGKVVVMAKKRATPIPPDWSPNERDVEFAHGKGWDMPRLEVESEKFRNYHQAHGKTMLDWHAAWRTWVAKANEFAARDSHVTVKDASVW